MNRITLSAILFVVGLPAAFGQSTDSTKLIDAIFTQWSNVTPGGAIVVSRGEKILYNKAFGMADLEHNIPNTTETIFESGSVAKQFTAMSILLLAAEGKLSLQDDVHKYFPDLPVYDAPITVQHLLNHTSGLKDWGTVGALTGWPRGSRVYTLALALEIIFRQKSLNFTPGSEYSYSNSNFSLLVSIVEKVSKQSLAQFTQERLFGPLGMTHTQWRDDFRRIVRNRAIAYSKPDDVYLQNMPFENIHGHGGLLTTTGDLLKWNKILETHAVGGDPVAALRIKKGKLNNGTEIKYAAGLFIDELSGFTEIGHTGGTAGYRAWLGYYPQKKLSVVILSNDGQFNPGSGGRKVAEVYLGKKIVRKQEPKFITLPEKELKEWQGIYRMIRGFDVLGVTFADGRLNTHNLSLQPVHHDTLFQNGIKFASEKSHSRLLQISGDTASYVRVPPPNLVPTAVQEFGGDYYSEEAEASITIELKGSDVWLLQHPETSFKLVPSFLDGFFTSDYDLVEFKRDYQGKVRGLEISMDRAERVPFVKTERKK